MISDDTKKSLSNIISGISIEKPKNNLNAARNFLCKRFETNTTIARNVEQDESKEKQRECLKKFISDENLWLDNFPNKENFLTEGGEAKIYFGIDRKSVIKLNDAIYYVNWLDFLNSLMIHNLLFNKTAYELLGFKEIDNQLFAVLKQSFIQTDEVVDLEKVKIFLEYNGFKNIRRNDYYNKELGLILEDIHDENVLIKQDTLFFIDTVFYINLL